MSKTSPTFTHSLRILAPMEGLTDPLMRRLLTQIATDLDAPFDWCVSEFVRVTHYPVHESVFLKAVPELLTNSKTASGTPIHVQLLGNHPTMMAKSAQTACALGAAAIDLNFGCPAKTVNNHKGGAILLSEPALMGEIIAAVRAFVPSQTPVSVKIRLGYDSPDNTAAIAQTVADSGASWLVVHARTKIDGYKPPAYWEKIAPLTQLAIPIIANGEIWTAIDAARCVQQAQTPHLMLGRGVVARPDLTHSIANHDLGGVAALTWEKLLPYQLAFLADNTDNEKGLIGRYKQWLGMLTRGYPEAATAFAYIKKLKTRAEICAVLLADGDGASINIRP